MRREPLAVIVDIQAAIEGIGQALQGKTIDDFKADWLLRHGVQRGIEIISEAVRHLPDDLVDAHPEVRWAAVRAVGNVLRHEYHRISDDIVWKMVTGDLVVLGRAMDAIRAVVEAKR